MPRAVSIHIGVNQPWDCHTYEPLKHSEDTAWKMAELASQAGYQSLLVLRGETATRQAVHSALSGASQLLKRGDTLFVSFSGHGGREVDVDGDERDGEDETWCLADGHLLDDQLAAYWRLFERGVRIVVVAESCYGGGMGRTGDGQRLHGNGVNGPAVVHRTIHPPLRGTVRSAGPAEPAGCAVSFTVEQPRDACHIRASVLMLTASREDQRALDGVFTKCLLEVWDNGAAGDDYCGLYTKVRAKVMCEAGHEPQLLLLGTPDEEFPCAPAFRVDAIGGPEYAPVTRGRPWWDPAGEGERFNGRGG
jgi:hypothetical protein